MRPTMAPDKPALWVFGYDMEDIDRRQAAEVEAGRARPSQGFPVIWRGDDPVPPPRWAKGSDLTPEENEDWVATMVLMVGGEPHERGDKGWPLDLHIIIDGLKAEIERRAAA
ncbi:hypothetical protein [Methylobacterium planeticum]|uniref:Uncharacterized protein n=1 Tax=Methylobacterium planeticum TaxID=2615211 RepID=A0A6N6MEK5_9HYPH|nr:hypothetical protein [Methylobacterium planeticum]KAB1068185.1 hypothetical protein F6X51_27125 [Methylobacterium planeticum]